MYSRICPSMLEMNVLVNVPLEYPGRPEPTKIQRPSSQAYKSRPLIPVGVMWFIQVLFSTSQRAVIFLESVRKRTAIPAEFLPKSQSSFRIESFR